MHWNIIKDDEFGSIKFLKLKYRRGDEINQTFCKIASAQKLSPPLFNFYKSWDSEKSTPDSWRMHWNVTNGKEFGSTKLLKLKYRRGDQIIQNFCKIASPKKLGPHCLILINLNSLRKVLLNHAVCIKI